MSREPNAGTALAVSPGMKLWALPLLLVLTLGARCEPPHAIADAAPPVRAATLVGAWTGHWSSDDPAGHGSAEVVLSQVPGREDVVGHFTFMVGGKPSSARYEGRVENGRVSFALVGDGHIVLEPVDGPRPTDAHRLRGEWSDARAALPAAQGVMELSRAR